MSELTVFGYVVEIVAVFVVLWVGWEIVQECKATWIYEWRRSQAFKSWRNRESHLRGME